MTWFAPIVFLEGSYKKKWKIIYFLGLFEKKQESPIISPQSLVKDLIFIKPII